MGSPALGDRKRAENWTRNRGAHLFFLFFCSISRPIGSLPAGLCQGASDHNTVRTAVDFLEIMSESVIQGVYLEILLFNKGGTQGDKGNQNSRGAAGGTDKGT